MMLAALVAYAEREGLGDLDFEARPVDYELRIGEDGSFVGLISLMDGKKRPLLSGLPIGPSSKNNPGYPSFIVDNAQYVLSTAKENAKAENVEKCFSAYVGLVKGAAQDTGDPGLIALRSFLDNSAERMRADAMLAAREDKSAAKRGDKILVPILDTDGSRRIHQRPAVMDWWKQRRESERAVRAEGPVARCLITGRVGAVARTHPALKGPPFPTTGAKLVAFNRENPAFESQGLEQGDNAPIGDEAARKYTDALNKLLSRDPSGRRNSAIDLDSDSVVVFWTRATSNAPNLLLDLLAPTSRGEEAASAVASVWRGMVATNFDATPFYAVTLGVNSARVVVRDWFETTAKDLKVQLDRWFSDLRLGSEPEPIPLVEMLRALQATPSATNDKRGLAPGLAARVFRAAVQGSPLPRSLLGAAVQRMRLAPRAKEDTRRVMLARVGIIKAVLRRQGKEIALALDETNNDRAYLLGRLFAALEKLQLVASGRGSDLNASIRDRYYGAASTTPSAVFGRLISLSMHHASKAKDAGLGVLAERAKANIINRLPPDRFPRVLNLDDQGLFAVGYYHQQQAFFTKRSDDGPTT